nr:hypothetical protein [Hydrogenobacter thermophilus]
MFLDHERVVFIKKLKDAFGQVRRYRVVRERGHHIVEFYAVLSQQSLVVYGIFSVSGKA